MIVPDGVLFSSSNAHKDLRRILVEDQKLDAVISMPPGVFRPYAGVSTAILLFTKTNSGGTDEVWFYDMRSDGFSLDDKRTPQPERSDLPDILKRWKNRKAESKRGRTDQSFLVPKTEIVTIFPFCADPERHIFVKPEVTKEAGRRMGFELHYDATPNWKTYTAVLKLAGHLRDQLRADGAADFIDAQSFIWVVSKYDDPLGLSQRLKEK